jgi:hypothetical protein
MNNEPVAWMSQGGDVTRSRDYFVEMGFTDLIPLYTHPVKELDEQFKKGFEAGKEEGWKAHKFHHPVKELTDEEIYEVWKKAMQEEAKIEYSIYATQLERQPFVFFARAILRKAQDK